jgi:hypothetical protein
MHGERTSYRVIIPDLHERMALSGQGCGAVSAAFIPLHIHQRESKSAMMKKRRAAGDVEPIGTTSK